MYTKDFQINFHFNYFSPPVPSPSLREQCKCGAGISVPSLVTTSTNLHNRTARLQLTSPVRLSCKAEGQPPPVTSWYRDGNFLLNQSDTLDIRQLHTNLALYITLSLLALLTSNPT